MKVLVVVGIVVLLAGLSLILNAFQIHVPLFRVALGVLFGWFGVSLVLSGLSIDRPWLAFRPQRVPLAAPASLVERQDVIFAERELDTRHLVPGEHVKLGVIFGDVTVRYDPHQAIELRSSTAFGNTSFPDGTDIAFGQRTLRTPACADASDAAIVEVSTVFGTTRLQPVTP